MRAGVRAKTWVKINTRGMFYSEMSPRVLSEVYSPVKACTETSECCHHQGNKNVDPHFFRTTYALLVLILPVCQNYFCGAPP